ncbi:MAG: nucleotide sugar dehydrogenase [Candidatus Omnitrophica bacterium]|nr:nucleotide sugar dehydrogenase [Candidatus Omnitrophota bacterium]
MRKADRILISLGKSIYKALEQLEESKERLLICIDGQDRFVGVINDGDIRRALLRGAKVGDLINSFVRRDADYVTSQCNFNEAMRHITSRVSVLPVIDHERKVVGFYSFKEKEEFVDIKKRKVTILGMGYVGLTLSVVLSDAGFEVTGYDVNENLLKELRKGHSHFYEKGLQKYLTLLSGRNLRFVSNLEEARGSIYIITVGTPILKPQMKPNLEYAMRATKQIAKMIDSGDIVIFRSTLPLGFCRHKALPILEKESGLRVGRDFYLAYAPERTTEGQALKELRSNPQIVGGYDQRSKEIAARLFNCLTHSVIDVETLESAEMCKLVDNCFRDHVFAFANQMAPLAESFGLDFCKIVDAVNHGYHRNFVPKPSPGVGGACLSKDPYILREAFAAKKMDSSLVKHARIINERGPHLLKEKLARLLQSVGKDIKSAKIFLIGMAFKGAPETSDLRDSTSVWFLNELPFKKNVCVYDAVVEDKAIRALGIRPVSLKQGFTHADAVVVLNNHYSYQDMDVFSLTALMSKPGVFIDTWHIFEPLDMKRIEGIVYGGVGND